MTRPPKTRRRWTREEDDALKYFKTEYPNLPWGKIIEQAKLQDRDEKSCSRRWNDHLRPDINKSEFSPQEDELIIHLKSLGVSWASMRKEHLLERRPSSDIKNRWHNHLKKRTVTVSDPRRPLPNHVQQPLMNDQTGLDIFFDYRR
ncbi:hypothetical protein PVL29_020614 [Vitis rotundifolia]|uniref:Uncharacterized protein n=1 Tax=Vitis rotundifolia TaxID=103349 RepID=A0AA39DDQ5_VITRO|nr:hypothetical protein PVL29_020614 [Vitis rotundifolia]